MRILRQKGSFTIEAAILIPMVLVMMMTVLRTGIAFYQQSVNREIYSGIANWDAVSRFYEVQVIKEMREDVLDD